MIDDLIKKKINTQLIIAEKLSSSSRPEATDSAFLIIDHILERIGMCVYYEENISNKPQLKSKDQDAILDRIKRESFEVKLESLFNRLGNDFKQKIMSKHEIRNDIQHKFITINFSVDISIVQDYLKLVKEILNELGWLESINYEFIFKDIELKSSIAELSKYIGIWKTEYTIKNAIHKGLLNIKEENGEITAVMELNWHMQYYNSLIEKFSIRLKGTKLILDGINVEFKKRGNASETDYDLDHLVLELSEDGNSMKGKFIDVNVEFDIFFIRRD